MSSHQRIARTLGLALGLSLALGAGAAVAAPNGERPPAHAAGDRGHQGPRGEKRGEKPQFPMPAADFTKRVDQRLQKVAHRIERMIEKRKVAPELARQIRADLAQGSAQIRAAAGKAGADGTVTKQEAQQVREQARALREQAREKYAAQLGPKNKGAEGKAKRGQQGKRGSGKHGTDGRRNAGRAAAPRG